MAKCVLFDMMDTLVKEPYPAALERFFQNFQQKDFFFACKNRQSAHDFERGEISEREFYQRFYCGTLFQENQKVLPKPIKVKKYLLQNLHYISGMADLLGELQDNPNVQTGIASNYSEWYEDILAKLPALKNCDYLFFSCEMGTRKPETAYYKTITEALSGSTQRPKNPQDILFIDDRQINIEKALEAGWQAHLMQNSYEAKKAVQKFLEKSSALSSSNTKKKKSSP